MKKEKVLQTRRKIYMRVGVYREPTTVEIRDPLDLDYV